jgi:hypothetical protein
LRISLLMLHIDSALFSLFWCFDIFAWYDFTFTWLFYSHFRQLIISFLHSDYQHFSITSFRPALVQKALYKRFESMASDAHYFLIFHTSFSNIIFLVIFESIADGLYASVSPSDNTNCQNTRELQTQNDNMIIYFRTAKSFPWYIIFRFDDDIISWLR